jgi:hypothetical protein
MQGVGGVGGGRTSSAVVHTPMCNNKAVIITPVCVCMRARGLCVCWFVDASPPALNSNHV